MSSTGTMAAGLIQEIGTMTSTAKLAAQRADNYYKQANKAVKDARALEQRLETATRKLEQLHTGIVDQMKTVTSMIQALRDQNHSLNSNVSLLLTDQEHGIHALDTVLEKLASLALHPTLVAAAQAGTCLTGSSGSGNNTTLASLSSSTGGGGSGGAIRASPSPIEAGGGAGDSSSSVLASSASAAGGATSSSLLSDKSTLYDFVNIDSVDQLKAQADKEIAELKKLQTALGTVMHSIEEQYDHLLQSSETLLSRLQEARVQLPQQATSTQQLQRNEVDSMSKIVLTVVEHYDKLQFLLRNQERLTLSQQELLELRSTNGQLQNMINVLNTGLQKIHAYSAEIDSRSRLYHEFYRTAVNFYADLDSISPVIDNKVNQLDVLQSVFQDRKRGSEVLFSEIADLTTWYNLFHSAYGELLHEITRRNIEHRRQQKIIESYNTELAQMYSDELQKREQFYEFHGKYLPSYLCPAILEASVKYTITPVQETLNARLPIVDLTLSQTRAQSNESTQPEITPSETPERVGAPLTNVSSASAPSIAGTSSQQQQLPLQRHQSDAGGPLSARETNTNISGNPTRR